MPGLSYVAPQRSRRSEIGLEVISLLRGETNRSITPSAIMEIDSAGGKMADVLNVISTPIGRANLALPSKITVFALHTVAVFTHAGLNIHPYVALY